MARMTAEERRLQRIILDPEYGPALFRLRKTEQRTILDMISGNDSRGARKEILRLDAERAQRARERRAAKKSAPPVHRSFADRDMLLRMAYANVVSIFDIGQFAQSADYRDNLISNLKLAEDEELEQIAQFDRDGAIQWLKNPHTYRIPPGQKRYMNPMWYQKDWNV